MTKVKSIRECKRIWKQVLIGKAKDKMEALELLNLTGVYTHGCPFCEYARYTKPDTEEDCSRCPLVEQTGYGCQKRDIYNYHIPGSLFDYRDEPQEFASLIMALEVK